MKIVYCGDVVARAGREAVLNNIPGLKEKYKPDVLIVNIENAAHGFGATPGICRDFLDKGTDVLVTGNHVWQQRELIPFWTNAKESSGRLIIRHTSPGEAFVNLSCPTARKF